MIEQSPFEEHAKEYDNWFEKNHNTYLSELLLISGLFPASGKGIEIGVGTGRFAQFLKIKEGVDISKKMMEIAEKRGIKTHFAHADSLPFKDNSYNNVLMVTTICFVKDPLAALKEAYRILANNGVIVVGFVDKDSLIGKNYQKKKYQNKFYKNATFYNSNEIVSLLERANFKIQKIKQTLYDKSENITELQEIKDGHADGSFIGIKAIKTC